MVGFHAVNKRYMIYICLSIYLYMAKENGSPLSMPGHVSASDEQPSWCRREWFCSWRDSDGHFDVFNQRCWQSLCREAEEVKIYESWGKKKGLTNLVWVSVSNLPNGFLLCYAGWLVPRVSLHFIFCLCRNVRPFHLMSLIGIKT